MIVECQRQLVAADGVAQDIRDLSTQTNNEKKKKPVVVVVWLSGDTFRHSVGTTNVSYKQSRFLESPSPFCCCCLSHFIYNSRVER
jgi:hypothetical protein